LFQNYIETRVQRSKNTSAQYDKSLELVHQGDQQLKEIWDAGVHAATIDPNPVTTGLFMSSVNDVMDSKWEQIEIQRRHIPNMAMYLLFFLFIMGGAIMGYSSGLSMKRSYVPTVLLNVLMSIVVFFIIDLDRPKDGLIKVRQDYILRLEQHPK
jgi:hypothetical protein